MYDFRARPAIVHRCYYCCWYYDDATVAATPTPVDTVAIALGRLILQQATAARYAGLMIGLNV